jgi:hypothetical protein
MGRQYGIKCAECDYGISVMEGVGMMCSPNTVFYGYSENDKPLLLSLVKSKRIKNAAFAFLSNSATTATGPIKNSAINKVKKV